MVKAPFHAKLLDNLRKLKLDLAKAEEQLLGKQNDLDATVKDKEAIEAYLLSIKDGCDFITDNIDERKKSRENEAKALEGAVKLLKKSPAYVAEELRTLGNSNASAIEQLAHSRERVVDGLLCV